MKVKDLYKTKAPIVSIDNSLNKFVKLPVFQEKLDQANEVLDKVGLPKASIKAQG